MFVVVGIVIFDWFFICFSVINIFGSVLLYYIIIILLRKIYNGNFRLNKFSESYIFEDLLISFEWKFRLKIIQVFIQRDCRVNRILEIGVFEIWM